MGHPSARLPCRDRNHGGMTYRLTSALRAGLAGLAVGVLLVLLLPTPAHAHATLVSTDPVSGSILTGPPPQITLTFSEAVRPVAERIQILGPDGKRADTGRVIGREQSVFVELKGDLVKGTYLVSYRVVSSDSHPISGGFTWSLIEVSATPSDAATIETKVSPVIRTALAVGKYTGYVGLLLVVGPVLFMLALWPQRLSREVPARMAGLGLGLVVLGSAIDMYVQVPYTLGGGLFEVEGESFRAMFGSTFGAAHLVRIGVVVAVAVLLRQVNAGRTNAADRIMLSILGVVGIATWPISGHPSASPVPTLTVVADAAHLAAMAVWVGGLVMLFAVLLRKGSNKELRAILPIWSGWAMFAIAVLALAGTAQALVEIGTVSALTGTAYGRYVLVKAGLLSVVIIVAYFVRRMVYRGFLGDAREAPPKNPLRRGVLVELGVAAVIIGVTTMLVQTTPGRTAEANAQSPSLPFSQTVSTSLYQLQVNVEPTTVGPNTLHLYALTPDGKTPLTVLQWSGTAALPSTGVEPLDMPLLPITKDHSIGQVVFTTAGEWELKFTLRTTEIDQASVTVKVPIR